MKLDLISALLESKGLGTRGVDIFVHRMDSECNEGILLRNPLVGVDVDPNLPGYYTSNLQVIVRAPTQAEGDLKCKQITAALTIYRTKLPVSGPLEMQVNHIYPAKLPIVYLRSDGRSIEWSLNFHTSYVLA